jgi:putative DNA primase/helicase
LGHTNQQKFAIFIGASRAGKGILISVIEALLGENNYLSSSFAPLISDFGLEAFIGKKVVVFPDAQRLGKGRDEATEKFLSIVGEDKIYINIKNQRPISAKLKCRLMVVCNELPNLSNNRAALSNRLLVFPFEESFAGREDFDLLPKLLEELPGIFSWALDGVSRILAGERLTNSKVSKGKLQELIIQMDSVEAFAQALVTFEPLVDGAFKNMQPKVTSREAYEAYSRFCDQSGISAKSELQFFPEFARWLAERGVHKQLIKINGAPVKAFLGIRISSLEKQKNDQEFNEF